MSHVTSRRSSLLALGAAFLAACAPSAQRAESPGVEPDPGPEGDLAQLERSVGGRVGVFAVDTASGRTIARRADERFPMCSTFKWVLAAAVLARVDRGEIGLDDRLAYGQKDLLEYAPVTTDHVAEGAMTVDALVRAAVTVSDNTAANLLLAKVGGPEGWTAFVRAHGDAVTRLDRSEPALNSSEPGDERDTTTPRAMAGLLRAILCEGATPPPSRERLLSLMRACETGQKRLRAGLPSGWTVGDKTGTGRNGSTNDVAIAVPPGRAPILVAAYLTEGSAKQHQLEAAIAAIGRMVGRQWASG
jgi:beta-lactamase class A